jgi:hypothetical protein
MEVQTRVRGRATLTNTYHLKKRLFYVSKQGNIRFFKAEKRNIGTKILASKSKKTPVPDRLRKKLKQWKCEWGHPLKDLSREKTLSL